MNYNIDSVSAMEMFRNNGVHGAYLKYHTNMAHEDTPDHPIVRHDVNWPQHMNPEIEKGIPIPAKKTKRWDGRYEAYRHTLQRLLPGESFFVTLDNPVQETLHIDLAKISTCLNMQWRGHCPGKKFVSRSYRKQGGPIGIRVWRLE